MKAELRQRLLLPPSGARVLCAVSGGADSMCLLTLLARTGDYTLAAAHFEHGIRGEESMRDCAFVEEFCREKGIACFTAHADVPAYAAARGLGLEEAARELRYAFLEKTAEEQGFDWIATAHNADDNAETVLLHLVRGSGLAGLCGIPPQRGKIIRPLLQLTRAEIEALISEWGVRHVEDSSNESDFTARNRIRHSVTPVLGELNGSYALAVARACALLRRDEDCLDSQAAAFLAEHFDGESLPLKALAALHGAVASRALRRLLPRSAEEKHIEAILALCRGSELGYADLPGCRVRRERGRLYFSEGETRPQLTTALPLGKRVELAEMGLAVCAKLAPAEEEIHNSFKTYRLKYESICGNLSVSSPQPGDRYRPQGRGYTKTLKSLFSEKKATQRQKLLTPVFRDERGIVLVPPFGAAERCAVQGQEQSIIILIQKTE